MKTQSGENKDIINRYIFSSGNDPDEKLLKL